jgi:hypothetical protein
VLTPLPVIRISIVDRIRDPMTATADRRHARARCEYERVTAPGGFAPGARLGLIEGEIFDRVL